MSKKLKISIVAIAAVLVLCILAHVISALTMDKIIQYKQITLASADLPPDMEGYKIAFITDTHAMTREELRVVVEELNTQQLDLLVLGGDFASAPGAADRTMQELSQTTTTDGIYGVEGNHDNYEDLFAAMQNHGVTPLSNSGLYIREGFYLAGVEDLWNRNPDIALATQGTRPEDFILLLAHNADLTMTQDTTNIDLTLSGHTHGGQVTIFGLWAPELTMHKRITDYSQRFMSGWATTRDATPVYVSRGTGHLQKVPRVFARPQVILLTLVGEA